ncbi:MAG: Ureidoglycolate lyase [Alphaproteobacteria bacterium MarineAlpha11_Bin1]|nr:MAG: Ureidoglycolate lyase [Alphaproteobacteria bacterium MarineAlpha11_Bin1]|tara:strand:- start:12935 stop:13798 length:864 start_codon:yes stop_codon:yes gene_type:complete
MRFVSFKKDGKNKLGVRTEAGLVDLSKIDRKLPTDLKELIAQGKGVLQRAGRAAKNAKPGAVVKGRVSYLTPIQNPDKIFCIGLNYKDHAAEAGLKIPTYPVVFTRFETSFVANGQALVRPKASKHFDYEAEMVAVIGKKARNIKKSRALEYVAGYSVANEGSIRDYQMKASQWTIGKNFDSTGSIGPDFVTADELPPGAKGLNVQCRLNGKVLQETNTREMIFDVKTLVYELARAITLMPGDLILTGTGAGVGFVRKPPIFMKQGDICEIEIENVGLLSNPIRNEK